MKVDEAMCREDTERDAVLNTCDKEFYKLDPAEQSFFQFIQDHADRIQLERTDDYPRLPRPQQQSNASKLGIHLMFHKRGWNPDLAEAREVAKSLAREKEIPASDSDIEGAAALHVLKRAARAGDIEAGMSVVDRVFELMLDEPLGGVIVHNWVELLVKSERTDLADTTCLAYLKYLKPLDQGTLRTQNKILFWAKLLQAERRALPRAVGFFTSTFLGIDLDMPLPREQHLQPRAVPFTVRQPRQNP